MGLFPVSAYSNKTMNIHVQIFVLGTCVFVSFGCIPNSGVAGYMLSQFPKLL